MPNRIFPPYHIGEQNAVALLGPIDVALAELHARLTHYANRIRLSDEDRATILQAEKAVAIARGRVNAGLTEHRDAVKRS